MQKQQTDLTIETAHDALRTRPLSPFLQLVQAREHRKVRIAWPSTPPRPVCMQDRAVLAASRAAELAAWQASGGDFLRSR